MPYNIMSLCVHSIYICYTRASLQCNCNNTFLLCNCLMCTYYKSFYSCMIETVPNLNKDIIIKDLDILLEATYFSCFCPLFRCNVLHRSYDLSSPSFNQQSNASGGSLQHESCNQVLDSTFGLGHLRGKLHLKYNYYKRLILLYCYFCSHHTVATLVALATIEKKNYVSRHVRAPCAIASALYIT